MVHLISSATQAELTEAADANRRVSGRRARARDRLMDRASQAYAPHPELAKIRHVENLMMFIDDDLRETALSMERIERYLISTLDMLEADHLVREDVHALATDLDVLDQIDLLNESLESLRRRVARLSHVL